jgi:hypothetical protein
MTVVQVRTQNSTQETLLRSDSEGTLGLWSSIQVTAGQTHGHDGHRPRPVVLRHAASFLREVPALNPR